MKLAKHLPQSASICFTTKQLKVKILQTKTDETDILQIFFSSI